jgi:hypothetical protein
MIVFTVSAAAMYLPSSAIRQSTLERLRVSTVKVQSAKPASNSRGIVAYHGRKARRFSRGKRTWSPGVCAKR